MTTTFRTVLIGVGIVTGVALLGYFTWQERQTTSAPVSTASPTSATSSTSTGSSVDISSLTVATTTGGYTIKPITSQVAPNYKTPLAYSAGFDANVKAQDQSQFATLQTTLASKPTDYNSWLELAALRESIGDYSGAAADWKYVTELYPSDPTAFANLGDLYANFMHQPSQGITYYKQAIKLDPTKEETFYDNLTQIYLNEGDKADAKATLQQGISAQVIGYQNLQNELNSMH